MSRPLRVLIADADAAECAQLKALIAQAAPRVVARVVGEVGEGIAALDVLARELVDVLIVALDMPGMEGIELARHLAGREGRPAVVFISGFDPQRLPLMRELGLDVLLRPLEEGRVASAILHARKLPAQAAEDLRVLQLGPRRYLSCLERGRIRLIPIEEVMYLRAELKYVTARTATRDYLLDASLTQLEQEFGERFLRVHRNCLVARRWIEGFERAHDAQGEPYWCVRVQGVGERLPVSRRQWPLVRGAAA